MKSVKRVSPIVLSKGLGQGSGTEEFRLVLPEKTRGGIVSQLDDITDWSILLAPLYERTKEDLSRQYAILLSDKEFATFCVSPTKDKFGRRSVVIVGLVFDREYEFNSAIVAEALDHIRNEIDLVAEAIDSGSRKKLKTTLGRIAFSEIDSVRPALFDELLKTSSYAGAATPLLLGLGADIVIGTAHEALDAVRSGKMIKAYLDTRSGLINSLSRPETDGREDTLGGPKESLTRRAKSTRDLLQEILARLDSVDAEIQKLRVTQKKMWDKIKWRRW